MCVCVCYPSVSCEVPNARLLFDWQSEGRINCLSGNAIAFTITPEKTRVRHKREREPIWLSLIAENVKVNWGTQQFTIPALVQKPLKAHERRQKDFDQNCLSNLTFTLAAYYFFFVFIFWLQNRTQGYQTTTLLYNNNKSYRNSIKIEIEIECN